MVSQAHRRPAGLREGGALESGDGAAEHVVQLRTPGAAQVIHIAGFAQILVIDWTWHPGVPHALGMLSGSLPAVLTGAFLYMAIRLGLEGSAPGVPLARAPLRLAPVLLAAAAFTALGLWLLWEQAPLNGVVVIPALTFWGAAAGEWVVHRWLARGRDASALLARFILLSAAGVAWLMIAASFLNTPQAELEVARGRCDKLYARPARGGTA